MCVSVCVHCSKRWCAVSVHTSVKYRCHINMGLITGVYRPIPCHRVTLSEGPDTHTHICTHTHTCTHTMMLPYMPSLVCQCIAFTLTCERRALGCIARSSTACKHVCVCVRARARACV